MGVFFKRNAILHAAGAEFLLFSIILARFDKVKFIWFCFINIPAGFVKKNAAINISLEKIYPFAQKGIIPRKLPKRYNYTLKKVLKKGMETDNRT